MKKKVSAFGMNEGFAKAILLVLTVGFLSFFYGKVILSPNSYLFDSSGDGMKNYFTYIVQSEASSYTESTAMNYPYGESFLYLDCHPLLTLVLKDLSKPFPSVLNNSVGIVNSLMILSMLLTACLLYFILRRFSVTPILAALSAFAIMVLSPQIFRMTGHYALSYSCFIPLTWYLYIRYDSSRKKLLWSLIMGMNALFWFYIHAYMGMIAVAFSALLFLGDFALSFRSKSKDIWQYFYFLIQSLLPLICFWGIAKLLDVHTGRTTNPYGFLNYTSNVDSVFLPNHPPLNTWAYELFHPNQIWEGWAYIGLASIVVILIAFFFTVKKSIVNRKFLKDSLGENRLMIISLIAAILLLMLSFGYPFNWRMEWLLDKVPVIKNFRGVGRFAWVFYFVITVFSVKYLDVFIKRNSSKQWLSVIPFLIPAAYFAEGVSYHNEISFAVTRSANLFKKEQLSDAVNAVLAQIPDAKYQAIIPLPYYHIGSENFGKSGTDKSYRSSMIVSYHSGLPLMSNYSTRTSIWESKKLMELISPPFYPKNIREDLSDKRPFLILYTEEELGEWEDDLLKRSHVIFKNDELQLNEISFDELFKNTAADEFESFHQLEESLVNNSGFMVNPADSSAYVFFDSLDKTPQPVSLSGGASLSDIKHNYCLLKKFEKGELEEGKNYIASFWIYNQGENYGQDVAGSMIFLDVQYADGRREWLVVDGITGSFAINGDWSMEEYCFSAPEGAEEYSIFLKGTEHSQIRFYVDDLLIREKGTNVYRLELSDDGKELLRMNNHRIQLP